ncbi:hypothetical protein GU926_14680 [Nibribacter ruber]|uniref:Uncharacterized protein n=1 Tax=Nibribacter ruber TaxID=2698458 RepID=A0A6P1P2J6_9BACT|nr:hypothetical protein [Nibribacter ruber]QHL88605.1 hypothetical protein GU926_14680 [Nibribacter ruber]
MKREIYLRCHLPGVREGNVKETDVRQLLFGTLTLLKEPGLSNLNQLQNLQWELEDQTDRGDWLHFNWEMTDLHQPVGAPQME